MMAGNKGRGKSQKRKKNRCRVCAVLFYQN